MESYRPPDLRFGEDRAFLLCLLVLSTPALSLRDGGVVALSGESPLSRISPSSGVVADDDDDDILPHQLRLQ